MDIFSANGALLALLAAVRSGVDNGSALPTQPTSPEAINALVYAASGIISPRLRVPADAYPEGVDVVHAEIFADLSCQLLVQAEPMTTWSVTQFTLGWNPVTCRFDHNEDVDAASIRAFGVAHCDAATALAGIVARGIRSPYLDLAATLANPDIEPRAQVALGAVLAKTALPVDRVGAVLLGELEDVHGLAARSLGFWLRYPIIHLGGSHYMTAPARFLFPALGVGHGFRILEAGRALRGDSRTAVSSWIGDRFEELLGMVLRGLEERGEVFPATSFRADAPTEESTDFIVADTGDPTVTLIEAKSRSLRGAHFFGVDPLGLYDNVAELHAPFVQSIKFVAALDATARRGELTAAGQVLHDRVFAARDLVLCLAVPSMPIPVSGAHFRSSISRAVDSALAARTELATFWRAFQEGRSVHWVILDSEDLCGLVGRVGKTQLGCTLVQYARRCGEVSVDAGGFLGDVLDFVRESEGNPEMNPPREIRLTFSSFMQHVSRTWFGRDLPPE